MELVRYREMHRRVVRSTGNRMGKSGETQSQLQRHRRFWLRPLAAALIYFGCAVVWFAAFERIAVTLGQDAAQKLFFKGLVGLFFVIASALAVSWIVWREFRKQHQIQEELRQTNATLEQRVAERTADLQALNGELESFCYSVAHDLRAPLRGIQGFACLLEEETKGTLSDSASASLDRIKSAATRMGQLIEAWLQLSRIARGQVQSKVVDLSALAEIIVRDLRHISPKRPVLFVCSPGLIVSGDPSLLRILLENLLGNAWKFTENIPDARIEFGVDPAVKSRRSTSFGITARDSR